MHASTEQVIQNLGNFVELLHDINCKTANIDSYMCVVATIKSTELHSCHSNCMHILTKSAYLRVSATGWINGLVQNTSRCIYDNISQ